MTATPPLLAATAVPPDVRSLVLVLAASALGAILSRFHHRLVLPTVVVEIVLGILIGPAGARLGAASTPYIDFLSNFGLVFLFFFAGLEVVEKHVPRRSVARGTIGWAGSLALGCAVGYALHAGGLDAEGWLIGVALATTALGTLVPILADAGLLPTPLGRAVLGTGVAGEFWPIVVISVFLTGVYGAAAEAILLVVFGRVVAGCAAAVIARAAAAAPARPHGDDPHDRPGRRPALGARPRGAGPARQRRRLRLRARRARCGPDRRPRARPPRAARSCGCGSRGSASAS